MSLKKILEKMMYESFLARNKGWITRPTNLNPFSKVRKPKVDNTRAGTADELFPDTRPSVIDGTSTEADQLSSIASCDHPHKLMDDTYFYVSRTNQSKEPTPVLVEPSNRVSFSDSASGFKCV